MDTEGSSNLMCLHAVLHYVGYIGDQTGEIHQY